MLRRIALLPAVAYAKIKMTETDADNMALGMFMGFHDLSID